MTESSFEARLGTNESSYTGDNDTIIFIARYTQCKLFFFGTSAAISALVRIPQATTSECEFKIGLRQVVLHETATRVQGDTTLGTTKLCFQFLAPALAR